MTHTEKLQQIFAAALKENSEFDQAPTRAFPSPSSAQPMVASQPASAQETAPIVESPADPATKVGLSAAVSAE